MNSPSARSLAETIDAILPQTQCTRCGYPACKPYAEAIANGEADFNQCPPGGQSGIVKLADLLGRAPKPLNPANGQEGPLKLAYIDEASCIGCTLCIQACPVDAIVGASKQMHTVIAELCTGCELCVPPCPVDCIAMIDAPAPLANWTPARADGARRRYQARHARLSTGEENRRPGRDRGKPEKSDAESMARKALIQAALERARNRQSAVKPRNTENLPAEIERRISEIDARRAKTVKPDSGGGA